MRKQKVERAATRMEERHDRKLRGTETAASQLEVPAEKKLRKGDEVWFWLRPLPVPRWKGDDAFVAFLSLVVQRQKLKDNYQVVREV